MTKSTSERALTTATTEPEAQHAAPSNPRLTWSLCIAHHPIVELLGRRRALPAGASVELGRGVSFLGGGVFEDASISRRHARLSSEGDRLVVQDLESRNGTFLNGLRCARAELVEGDVVGLGPALIVVERAPPDHRAPRHDTLIGSSYPLARVLDEVRDVAPHPTSVLLCGPSGSGKELLAREIHALSGRPGKLCSVNSGALTDSLLHSQMFGHARGAFSGAERDHVGFIESAHQGTLFLDEIGEASPDLQVSLLRFLEDGQVTPVGAARARKVDVRTVTASHRDLPRMIRDGAFREDLYARLAGWVIRVPALSERVADIPLLAAHFVRKHQGRDVPLHKDLVLSLLLHSWPRNVRELRTVVERALIDARGAVPVPLSPAVDAQLALRRARRSADGAEPGTSSPLAGTGQDARRPGANELSAMLAAEKGNVRRVSAKLKVSRNTLYRWLREHVIDLTGYRSRGG